MGNGMHRSTEVKRGMPGVIWITGFSAAGKTTVGRRVAAELQALGLPTIFLDGDDLRSILGSSWGYEREPADRPRAGSTSACAATSPPRGTRW